jgi:hypothetical protein
MRTETEGTAQVIPQGEFQATVPAAVFGDGTIESPPNHKDNGDSPTFHTWGKVVIMICPIKSQNP